MRRILEGKNTTIITTIDGGMDKVLPLDFIKDRTITIDFSSIIKTEELRSILIHLGYERQALVERPETLPLGEESLIYFH